MRLNFEKQLHEKKYHKNKFPEQKKNGTKQNAKLKKWNGAAATFRCTRIYSVVNLIKINATKL